MKLANQSIPVIDVTSLVQPGLDPTQTAKSIRQACCEYGFFYVKEHGISLEIQNRLECLSHRFFALDLETKMKIRMEKAGIAWRGYFPVKGELTSGLPDLKEGLYFGEEHSPQHPEVLAGTPTFGANLYPDLEGFDSAVLEYMKAVTHLGHHLMRGISLSLGLEPDFFDTHYTHDPTLLFRIFHYPAVQTSSENDLWGVGEHTDYGLITLLKQDLIGGLQVKSGGQWIDATPLENTFVCNIGDMLERMTGGLYVSTPHRVRNTSLKDRYSYPLFFDPGFRTDVRPVFDKVHPQTNSTSRWDQASVHDLQGTYGDYLLSKISKVFPSLAREK